MTDAVSAIRLLLKCPLLLLLLQARNPTRDLPISIVTSLAIATLLYVLMSTAIVMMVPYAQINVHAPFSAAFLQHGMVWVAKLVSVGALLGELG